MAKRSVNIEVLKLCRSKDQDHNPVPLKYLQKHIQINYIQLILPVNILSAEGLPSGFIFNIRSMMGITLGIGSALL